MAQSQDQRPVWALLAAIMVVVIVLRVLGDPRGPPVCRDGWPSKSIGKYGACSHHGGVNYEGTDRTPAWVFGVAIGAGVITFLVPALRYGFFRRPKKLVSEPLKKLEDVASQRIQEAIERRQHVRFIYTGSDGSKSIRTVRPVSLDILEPFGWDRRSLTGFCLLRNAERQFLLARMADIEIIP